MTIPDERYFYSRINILWLTHSSSQGADVSQSVGVHLYFARRYAPTAPEGFPSIPDDHACVAGRLFPKCLTY